MLRFNPFLDACQIHNDALDFFIANPPDPTTLTLDSYIEPFVDYAVIQLNDSTEAFRRSFRTACKQVVYLNQNFSLNEFLANAKISGVTRRYIHFIQSFDQPENFEALEGHIDRLTNELIDDTLMGINDKLAAFHVLAIAKKSVQYWAPVRNNPSSPWEPYRPNAQDPTLFSVAVDASYVVAVSYGGSVVFTGIWGENQPVLLAGYIVGAILGAVGSAGFVLGS